MHSPEKMLQIAKVGYLQIFGNVNTISSRTVIIPLILTILNSNKATNSSELLKIGGNTSAVNSFPAPAMLPHLASGCTSAVPSGGLLPSQILMLNYSSSTFDLQAKTQQIIKIILTHLIEKGCTHEQIEDHIKMVTIVVGKTVINNWKQQAAISNNRFKCRKIEYTDSAFSFCVIQQNSMDHNGCNLSLRS